MTKREQHRFVRDLLTNIHRDIRDAIRTNGIPGSWDGIELREYIAEKTDRARATHALVGQRARAYRNLITISAGL
jgi:hypothetical protein